MSNLAIIPARGGSKRITFKNIKNFLGKPIISFPIKVAFESRLFAEVMVSTDDSKIAEISKLYGAKIPFMRSKENSDDFATLNDVVYEVVSKYASEGINFDYVCCILPTAVLMTSQQLSLAYNKMKNEILDSVCSITKYSNPILRALEFYEDNLLKMIWPQYLEARSQDLKPTYYDAGHFYWVKTAEFIKEKNLLCKNGSAITISELETQDIDNDIDWKLAELKYELLQSNK